MYSLFDEIPLRSIPPPPGRFAFHQLPLPPRQTELYSSQPVFRIINLGKSSTALRYGRFRETIIMIIYFVSTPDMTSLFFNTYEDSSDEEPPPRKKPKLDASKSSTNEAEECMWELRPHHRESGEHYQGYPSDQDADDRYPREE